MSVIVSNRRIRVALANYVVEPDGHFKGKYTSLAQLQAAYPTAEAGDYAEVDTGPGSNVLLYLWDSDEGWVQSGGGGSFTLTDGNGTTANGTAVDLGGTLNKPTTIDAGIHGLVIKYDDGGLGVGTIEWASGTGLSIRQLDVAGSTTELNFGTFGDVLIQSNAPGFPGLKYGNNNSDNYEDDSLPAWRDVKAYADSLPINVIRTGDAASYVTNITNAVAASNGSLSANVLKAFPVKSIVKNITAIEIVTEVTTLVGATTYRVGIYTDVNGYPGSLIANSDVSTYDSSTTGVKTGVFSTPISLPAGIYWIVVNSNGAASYRANAQSNTLIMSAFPTLGANPGILFWTIVSAYGEMPSSFPVGASGSNSGLPIIFGLKTT